MMAAIKSVINENIPISWAVKMQGVPKSTLHNHISGNVTHGDNSRSEQLLSPAEEEEFSNFLVKKAQASYGKTRKELRNIAGGIKW